MKIEDTRTPFHQVLRNLGFHSLAAKHGAPLRPAPTVDVGGRHGAAVSGEGTWATKTSYGGELMQAYCWRGGRRWD